ncbi:MAG: 5-formyltetrahydrofolate cyclo-ligase [Legionella sp.]|nr:5-formyltetrahydrofolate cyclo-ligase [Legionella sp.]
MSPQNKHIIRQQYLTQREALTEQIKLKASRALCARIESLDVYQNASHIALYQAHGGEISLHALWLAATAAGKKCYMPVIMPDTKTLKFLPATTNTAHTPNQFHILEPDAPDSSAITLEQINLMLLPLVAFDKHGTRLGRGAGYYDKTLENKKPACLLGAAYDFQQHVLLNKDPWDIPLDAIATEKNIYWSTP